MSRWGVVRWFSQRRRVVVGRVTPGPRGMVKLIADVLALTEVYGPSSAAGHNHKRRRGCHTNRDKLVWHRRIEVHTVADIQSLQLLPNPQLDAPFQNKQDLFPLMMAGYASSGAPVTRAHDERAHDALRIRARYQREVRGWILVRALRRADDRYRFVSFIGRSE